MSPKTSPAARSTGTSGTPDGAATPGRITVLALVLLALALSLQNTGDTRVTLLVTEVTLPLWSALLATGAVGALCGAYLVRRRD
ncbi:LapA family protein [Streptomyces sp. NPDC086091]|uniref:LapA family protein n=1 Tax=unclassified Streptomyces TaxID=2593676 RepID=UPI003814EA30